MSLSSAIHPLLTTVLLRLCRAVCTCRVSRRTTFLRSWFHQRVSFYCCQFTRILNILSSSPRHRPFPDGTIALPYWPGQSSSYERSRSTPNPPNYLCNLRVHRQAIPLPQSTASCGRIGSKASPPPNLIQGLVVTVTGLAAVYPRPGLYQDSPGRISAPSAPLSTNLSLYLAALKS